MLFLLTIVSNCNYIFISREVRILGFTIVFVSFSRGFNDFNLHVCVCMSVYVKSMKNRVQLFHNSNCFKNPPAAFFVNRSSYATLIFYSRRVYVGLLELYERFLTIAEGFSSLKSSEKNVAFPK